MEWTLLNPVDYVIIAIISMSFILSLWRGLIKEAMSLLIWFASFVSAMTFADILSPHFQDIFSNETLRYGLSFVLIFFITLVLGTIFSFVLGKLILASGLSGIDRLLGGVFGFLRGVLIVTIAVLLLSMTSMVHQSFWTGSQLIPTFSVLAESAAKWVPSEIFQHFNFSLDSHTDSGVYNETLSDQTER